MTRRIEHNGEIILVDFDASDLEIAEARRRVDERRGVLERHHRRVNLHAQIRDYLARDGALAAHDVEVLMRARAEDAEGRQRLAELARQEEQDRLEQEQARAEEAAAQRRPEELRAAFAGRPVDQEPSWLELTNDRNILKQR